MSISVWRDYLFLFILLSSLSISGCSTTGKTPSNDAMLTTAEGTLAGLTAGLLAGGGTKKMLVGAAVGTGVGAAIASTKESYKNQEDAINKEISALTELLQKLKSVNKSLKKDIEAYRKHVAVLKTQLRRDASKKADLDMQNTIITDKQADIQKVLEGLDGEVRANQESYEKMKASIKTKTEKARLKVWQDKIAALKKEKVQLENHSGQLQIISNSLGS